MTDAGETKVRIGILGTGFGQTHMRIFNAFPDVEVAGIVGRDEQKTMEIARSLGIPGYTRAEILIDDPSIDAIDVCLPTAVHADTVIAALSHDKHVFCETPVAFSVAEADRMAQVASRRGRLLLVALFARFGSEYKHVHELVESGEPGKPEYVFASRRTPAIWGEWDENFIANLMLHDIDIVTWMLGTPRAVTASGLDNQPGGWKHVVITMEYAEAVAVVEGCGIMPASFPFSTSLRVVGSDGAIDLAWRMAGNVPESDLIRYPQQGDPEVLSVPGYDPYVAECRYFIDCVQGKADPGLLGIDTAVESLRAACAAKESLEQGGTRISLNR